LTQEFFFFFLVFPPPLGESFLKNFSSRFIINGGMHPKHWGDHQGFLSFPLFRTCHNFSLPKHCLRILFFLPNVLLHRCLRKTCPHTSSSVTRHSSKRDISANSSLTFAAFSPFNRRTTVILTLTAFQVFFTILNVHLENGFRRPSGIRHALGPSPHHSCGLFQ